MIYVNRAVCKTFIFQLLISSTFTIYTPYGEITIDLGMPDEINLVKSLRFSEKQSLRVVSGIEDTLEKYPYVVALGRKPEDVSPSLARMVKNTAFSKFWRTCTGSLISEQWVLTAAHCVINKPTKIRYGNLTVLPNDTMATYSNILKTFIYPNFIESGAKLRNDIALLLVDRVRLSLYGRVSAVDSRTLVGLPVKYVGLGSTNTSIFKDQVRNRLYGEAAVAPCPDIVKKIKIYPMLCLIRKCANLGQATGGGDSGGPLLQAGGIVGVLTGKIGHAELLRPMNIYTAVSPFLDWIRTTMHSATLPSEH